MVASHELSPTDQIAAVEPHRGQEELRKVMSAPGLLLANKNGMRVKSLTETALELSRAADTQQRSSASRRTRSRPFSAGDAEDLRRVMIAGYSQNSKGTWMFKVDVGTDDELNAYVIRRRFSDFKELYDAMHSLAEPQDQVPQLPHHGIVSWLQLYVSPESLLKYRAEQLQKLLEWISENPRLHSTKSFAKFIGKNPSSLDVGYVSLSTYEVPASESNLSIAKRPRARCQSG
ncbi:TPA: hypothetical protein N0F65_008074 [Lagenidium giganteum]|uniref:PX domain-containing protein n=1 Tax=Lagenidium giganteum TaxID=4803 RepID=A0AAV2YT35_9STRA|nr:TPA: hypothetical protein N0F65_008074 [Lagenidium giganteum]